MAPDIAKVDANRHLHLGLPAWDFCDEVLRWLLHGNSLYLPERPAHPIYMDYEAQLAGSASCLCSKLNQQVLLEARIEF
jgi:hypothetical protein